MITAGRAAALRETCAKTKAGIDKLLDTVQGEVDRIEDCRADPEAKAGPRQNQTSAYRLAQVLRAVLQTQRNQAAILDAILEGYVEPEPPLVVQPQHEPPPAGADAPPAEATAGPINGAVPIDPNNPLKPVIDALSPPTPPHHPPTDKETF